MTDEDLKTLCASAIGDSRIFNSEIQTERQQNLDRYIGDPIGDEREGSSRFQTTDVHDVVEGLMPYMIENCLSQESVAFVPQSAEDVEQAKLETAYTRHVFFEQNPGFLIGETWMKDALLQKTGIIKIFWDEDVREEKEAYEALNFAEYREILKDKDVELKAETIRYGGFEVDTLGPVESMLAEYDIEVVRKSDVSQARVINIPPENFFIERNYTGLDLNSNPGCDFCAHLEERTVSDLLQDGYSIEDIERIPDADTEYIEEERVNRYSDEGGVIGQAYAYDANRKVYVVECYMRVDYDGDGYAELRKVTVGGTSAQVVLDNEEVDKIPFHILCPEPLPHRFYGMCPADRVRHIQLVKTSLIRQVNDNIYLTNNPRKRVLANSVENLDQLIESRVGGVVVTNRPDAIQDEITPFVAKESLPIMDLYDQMREERTGWSRNFAGLDTEAFNDNTIYGVSKMMGAAQARAGMYVRRFLEGGFKTAFLHVQELVQKYEKNQRMFEYYGEFVQVNPRSWRKRNDVKILVGVGNASNETKLAHYTKIAEYLRTIVELQGGGEGPLVGLENVYNLSEDTIEAMGIGGTPGRYIRKPETYQPPPPQPDPQAEALRQAMQIEMQKLQQESKKSQEDYQLRVQELMVKKEQGDDKETLEKEKMTTDSLLQREKMQKEEDFKKLELATKTQVDLLKTQSANARSIVQDIMNYVEKSGTTEVAQTMQTQGDSTLVDAINAVSERQALINDAMVRAMAVMNSSQASMSQNQVEALSEVSSGVRQSIDELQGLAAYIAKPRKPIYDDDGNVVRIEVEE